MRIKKIIIAGSLIFCLAIPSKAYAGSINGNEQTVLGIVQGGFEYNGIYYKAAPGYVEKVRSYLAQDDVDLTAEQASEAASEIYANIATGVSEGYIIPKEDVIKESTGAGTGIVDGETSVDTGEKSSSASSKKEQIIIHADSGMVTAIDEDGKQLFVAESVIKDTGYSFAGIIFVFILFLTGLGLCMTLIIKNNLLARSNEP